MSPLQTFLPAANDMLLCSYELVLEDDAPAQAPLTGGQQEQAAAAGKRKQVGCRRALRCHMYMVSVLHTSGNKHVAGVRAMGHCSTTASLPALACITLPSFRVQQHT